MRNATRSKKIKRCGTDGKFVSSVKKFHKDYYVPENVTLFVIGESLDPRALLEKIERTTIVDLKKLRLHHGPGGPSVWMRPFLESDTAFHPARIAETKAAAVKLPAVLENGKEQPGANKSGEVWVSWMGPQLDKFLDRFALSMLCKYLAEDSISPLHQTFVMGTAPRCSGM